MSGLRRKALVSYSKALGVKSLAWSCVFEAACTVAIWANDNARKAEACAELVEGRA